MWISDPRGFEVDVPRSGSNKSSSSSLSGPYSPYEYESGWLQTLRENISNKLSNKPTPLAPGDEESLWVFDGYACKMTHNECEASIVAASALGCVQNSYIKW